MKYLYYLFVLFIVIIRRVLVMFMIWVAIPFRGYARNAVYNYHLNNGIILKRLHERNPKLDEHDKYYLLHGGNHSSQIGLVKKRNVSKIEYILAMTFIWLWLDDDCNQDTYDSGFNKTIINKERKKWMPNFIVKRLRKAVDKANMTKVTGNSFDLGDVRTKYSLFEFWSVFWWTLRNPAYNFNYKFNQLCRPELAFKIVIFNRLFGWCEDGMIDGVYTYSWEFGRLYKKEI